MTEFKELKYVNTKCYYINGKALVDTDLSGTLPAFFKCAKPNGIDITELQYLPISHFHPDHMVIAGDLPPFHTIPAYNGETLRTGWQRLLAHGARTVKFGHFPDEKLNWQNREQHDTQEFSRLLPRNSQHSAG